MGFLIVGDGGNWSIAAGWRRWDPGSYGEVVGGVFDDENHGGVVWVVSWWGSQKMRLSIVHNRKHKRRFLKV